MYKNNKLNTIHNLKLPINQRRLFGLEKNAMNNRVRNFDGRRIINSQDPMKHTCGKKDDDDINMSRLINEEPKYKYGEDGGYTPPRTDMECVEGYKDQKINPAIYDYQGDQKDIIHSHEPSDVAVDENKRIAQIIAVQKSQIDRLLLENASIKEVNYSLTSNSEANTQYLSKTVNILQQKISELNTRLETHQVNTIQKDKNIQQLIEIVQDIPKQLQSYIINPGKPSQINNEDKIRLDTAANKNVYHQKLDPTNELNFKMPNKSHSIRVLCRIKPDIDNCLKVPTNDTIYLPPFKHFDNGMGFRLNKVFDGNSSQMDLFNEINPIVPSCFNKCNVCIITYGQSGSGKTHTMIGSESEPGIMMLSMKELFKIKNHNQTTIYRFHLTILEIYNENVYDLMNITDENNVMKTRVLIQDNGHSVQIKDVSEAEITMESEFNYYINRSLNWRSSSITARNVNSSRSHYLVMIRVSGIATDGGVETNRGSLIMCDLAGSENCNGLSDKEQTESRFINKSITMLNRVFDSMYRRLPAIPFRDSKLTHLLKPSLMGNAKCVFIATVCSHPDNITDTYRTLNLAKKVEMIHYNEHLN